MTDKKSMLRGVSLGMSTIVLVGAGLLSGCTTMTDGNTGGNKPVNNNPPAVQEDKQDKIMQEFMALVEKSSKPDVLIDFIEKNIAGVSTKDATAMLVELDKVQESYLPVLDNKFSNNAGIEEKLRKIYKPGFDLAKIEDIEDAELRSLLAETESMGYRIETAEGMYFPIMNYASVKKFSSYASEDMKAYIDIMAVESSKVPAKDAALVISWDEVVERALAQESFINKYGSSVRLEVVKKLRDKYLTFVLYGLNNTPLFSYDTKLMDPEAKAAYAKAVKASGDSQLVQLLDKYMELLEKNGYKLTDEVENFRKAESGSN